MISFKQRAWQSIGIGVGAIVLLSACGSTGSSSNASPPPTPTGPFLPSLHASSQVASTVPPNGDINPYGLVVVTQSAGKLVSGDALVSNFNASSNVQGTGTTIVQISPSGTTTVFAQIGSLPSTAPCPSGVGLTTALSILPGGYVVVGSLPTVAGGAIPTKSPDGCLIVLDQNGNVVETWTNPNINGPWDMTETSSGGSAELYLSDVLGVDATGNIPTSGPCDIVRIDIALGSGAPTMKGSTIIGSKFPWKDNPTALVQGNTGVALGGDGTLYVAQTLDSSITSIPNAATRSTPVVFGTSTLTKGGSLNGPLGLITAPNGDIIAANGNDGNIVEVDPQGHQVATVTLIPDGAGDLFGLAISSDGTGLLYTNDGVNALDLFHPGAVVSPTAIPTPSPT